MPASARVWKECESRLRAIKLGECQGRVVQEIDLISERLCHVLDDLNAKANLGLVPEDRSAARENFLALSERVQGINTDPELYSKLKQEEENANKAAAAKDDSKEAARVRSRLLMEFEWEGAALPNAKSRELVGKLQNDLREREYQAELEYHALAQNRPKMKISVNNGTHDEQFVELDNSEQVFHSIMFHEQNPVLRKQVYEAHFSTDPAMARFADTRQELRQARHEVANALGFASHAHFAVNKNMANDPRQVVRFLRQLAGDIQPIVASKLNNSPQKLHEWEYQRRQQSSTTTTAAAAAVEATAKLDRFFTLDRSLQGIAKLCEHLFDVKLVMQQQQPPTTTTTTTTTTIPSFAVYNEGQFVGNIELDLRPREGKSPHPCLFPLRTSCRTNHFAPARAVVSCSFGECIGHAGFRALMHEFGHALHTVLSTTEFQHLSGTRGEVDFIETPSSLLERMAWSEPIVRFMDGDNYFGPGDLRGLEFKRAGFAAFDLQEQVLHSLFDLNFHLQVDRPENDLYWDLRREFGPFQVPDKPGEVRRELFFPHVLGSAYAGSVYSYVWGAALTCDLWDALFAGDPLSQASGRRLKQELFEKGGAVNPHDVMTALVGRSEVDSAALLRDIQL